jgi:hypothetical protein
MLLPTNRRKDKFVYPEDRNRWKSLNLAVHDNDDLLWDSNVSWLVKESASYGTWQFIIVCTRFRHSTLSCVIWIQTTPYFLKDHYATTYTRHCHALSSIQLLRQNFARESQLVLSLRNHTTHFSEFWSPELVSTTYYFRVKKQGDPADSVWN